MMRRDGKWLGNTILVLVMATTGLGDTNLVITSFDNGMLSWTNIDPNLHYSVQWKPTLIGSNEWSASYRSCQDLQSTNPVITAPVPVFFRILGSDDPAYTAMISASNSLIQAGYYEDTNLAVVDSDLMSGNIRAGVSIFGITGKTEVVDTTSGNAEETEVLADRRAWVKGVQVTGSRQPAPVRKTGQTTSYHGNDDGDLQTGLAWPNPLTVADGYESDCVYDNLTGLYWLKDANLNGAMNWSDAINYCNVLTLGRDDWRLPTVSELQSLIDYSRTGPTLPSGHPFTNVQISNYWTATTSAANTNSAWQVDMSTGTVTSNAKTNTCHVWPVCGGEPGFQLLTWYYDLDGDGYGSEWSGPPMVATMQPHYDYVSNNLDPDDHDRNIP